MELSEPIAMSATDGHRVEFLMNSKSLYSIWIQQIARDSEEKVKCNYLYQIQLPLSVFLLYVKLLVSLLAIPHRNISQIAGGKEKKKLVSYISVNRQDYYLRILLWKIKGKNCKVRQMTDVNNIWRMLFPQEEIASGIQLTASSLNTHQLLGIVSSLKCTGMGTFPECTIIQQLLKSFIISQANITGIRQ